MEAETINAQTLPVKTRSVKFFLSQEGRNFKHETSAVTWGELMDELHQREDTKHENFTKKEVVVRETRNQLKLDSALLPGGDFNLYVYPDESKSGLDDNVKVLGYNKGRVVASYLNKYHGAKIDTSAKTNKILQGIEDHLLAKNELLSLVLEQIASGDKKKIHQLVDKKKLKAALKDNKKKSLKSRLAPESEPQAEDVKKEQSEAAQSVQNAFTSPPPQRIDLHIHIAGIGDLAMSLRLASIYDTAIKSANLGEDSKIPYIKELAGKIAEMNLLDVEKDIAKQAEIVNVRSKIAEDELKLEALRKEEEKLVADRKAEEERERIERQVLLDEMNQIGKELRR